MGIDRAPGEHLGPLRFRPKLDCDTRATGPESPLWEDTEVDRRERFRINCAPVEARDLAREILALARVARSLPPDAAAAAPSLRKKRDESE